MEVSKVFIKVKELGHVNSRREELREYCKIKIDQILKFLPRRILNGDGADLLDCLLNGLPDQASNSSKYKIKVVDIVLNEMRRESTSLTHTGDVISRVCLELHRLPKEHLVRWSGDSIQSIVEDKDVNMIWKDVLPECLSALTAHTQVKHCGTDMTVEEFKEQCVNTLCQCQWKEGQLVQLTSMFKDMNLSKANHTQVVNKICSYIIDINPDTLPPLVHQLMKLCKQHDMETVLHHLSLYFSARLYSKLEPPPSDSESTTMDIDELVPYSADELNRCLSTCIYHISQGAAEPELVRKHLKTWPKTQLLRNPFLLDLALALSDKGSDFRTVCLDVIKSAIEQNLLDVQKCRESSFLRSVLKREVDAATVLKVLTIQSANHRQLTVMGLINLAFSLLSTAGNRPTCHASRSLGKLVIVRISKSHPESATHILRKLADCLAGDKVDTHYAECLYLLCKLTPLSVERSGLLPTIVESCENERGVTAVRPLLAHSTRLRDAMTLVCRKRLYSREPAHRRLAVSGFLCLLRHTTATGASMSASQSEYSAHSCLTQLTVDLHTTGMPAGGSRVRSEALCLEVVSILRRCALQDSALKQHLYQRIYKSVKDKQFLVAPVLELFHNWLNNYVDGGKLLLDKCVQMAPLVTLTEPVSYLIYCCSQFLQLGEEELEDILASQDDSGISHFRSKLMKVLQDLCESDELAPLDMEDCGLTDLTPESKAKALKVQQILLSYEALIAHCVMQWDRNSRDVADRLCTLFSKYNQLLETSKLPTKGTKKGSKTLNETRDTIKSQKSQKSQKEKGKAPVKLSNLVKDRAGPFKPLPCLWDLTFCYRIIQLLYSAEVPWSSVDQRNLLRGRREFHRFALRSVSSVVTSDTTDVNSVSGNLVQIAEVIYDRCLCRFQDICDFDEQTAVACIELLKDCLVVLLSDTCSLKPDQFLPRITNLTENTSSASIAAILEQILSPLESTEASETDEDMFDKKTVVSLMSLANVLVETPVEPCTRYVNVIARLEDLCRSSNRQCVPLIGPLLVAGCRLHSDAPFLNDLLIKLTQALTTVDEEDSAATTAESPHFPYIDERTGHPVLSAVCAHLSERLALAAAAIARLSGAGHVTLRGEREKREIQDLQKSLVPELCQLTVWVHSVCKMRCSVGAGSDRVLTTCVRLYRTLHSFVKHLVGDVAGLRLERLFKLSGKKLSTATDNLITYLEACQEQQSSTKVLRETKHIPRLVLENELYCRQVILLAKNTKMNFQQYLSLGTARDFRIKGPVLEEMLKARDNVDDATRDNIEDEINDAETTVLSLNSDNEGEGASRKRRRKS